jgi:hypothetical protein
MLQQHFDVAGIFGGNQIHLFQYFQRPEAEIGQITYWRGNHV